MATWKYEVVDRYRPREKMFYRRLKRMREQFAVGDVITLAVPDWPECGSDIRDKTREKVKVVAVNEHFLTFRRRRGFLESYRWYDLIEALEGKP